ncbi:hypothetical protein PGT21_016346 [Puccinia graminis f. sp. tritici]|uniref:Uncharacterized protein n=2 Tax=Puccinia graminis f. sp. tritici TaxID=56615 RepID=E3KKQ2_PUCGT|nr:uncharacterized protein PGTG_10348 [Puccinia graminis f. sp. tritici CRL 75-36-700-3]EFP84877.2 hypothetical protein PGTG_10348 [Puccinia graminis f. sp. tritici CRL 75-36-700-3]KAA1069209.1 hypothetical protein PGT21_016346 [Puccinia graminis f. sp. tritici]
MESPPTNKSWLMFEGPITGITADGGINIKTTSSSYHSLIPHSFLQSDIEICGHVIMGSFEGDFSFSAATYTVPDLVLVLKSDEPLVRKQMYETAPGQAMWISGKLIKNQALSFEVKVMRVVSDTTLSNQ